MDVLGSASSRCWHWLCWRWLFTSFRDPGVPKPVSPSPLHSSAEMAGQRSEAAHLEILSQHCMVGQAQELGDLWPEPLAPGGGGQCVHAQALQWPGFACSRNQEHPEHTPCPTWAPPRDGDRDKWAEQQGRVLQHLAALVLWLHSQEQWLKFTTVYTLSLSLNLPLKNLGFFAFPVHGCTPNLGS